MSMSPKKIAIIAAVAVALIPTYFMLRNRAPEPEVVENQQEVVVENTPQPTLVNTAIASEKSVPTDASIKAFASAFVEQFGSYSNQASFGNIVALKPQMTDSFASWADGYVAEQRAKYPTAATYSGVTTRVLSVKLSAGAANAGTRTATVQTQQEITNGSQKEMVYKSMEVTLVYDGEWLVDSASWIQ
jgi:hypothetical protein